MDTTDARERSTVYELGAEVAAHSPDAGAPLVHAAPPDSRDDNEPFTRGGRAFTPQRARRTRLTLPS